MTQESIRKYTFLKNFFDEHISFLGNEALQYKTWCESEGPYYSYNVFGMKMGLANGDWLVLQEEKHAFNLGAFHLDKLENLFSSINDFIWKEDNPVNPSNLKEHRELLAHPDWKKIVRLAKQIYQDIYPTLKPA